MQRRQDDRAARVHGDAEFVAYFDASEIHQSGVEDDSLRIADLGNGLGHGRNTMFYDAVEQGKGES